MPDIKWKLHLKSPPGRVFRFLSTQEGRERFWAESAAEHGGCIRFYFVNGLEYDSKVISCQPDSRYEIEYFNSIVKIELADDGSGGTDLTLINNGVSSAEHMEVRAGWLSVLLALKGAADFGIDLRNHDKNKTWDDLYVDN